MAMMCGKWTASAGVDEVQKQMPVRSFQHNLTFSLVLALNLNDICIKCDNSGMI